MHFGRLGEPSKAKNPSRIFVGSMTDMMGMWWDLADIQVVADVCASNSRHTFLWLSKNPYRYGHIDSWPKNVWLGTTVTGKDDWHRVGELFEAAHNYGIVSPKRMRPRRANTFVSCEPLLGPAPSPIIMSGIDWIIIGPRSKGRKYFQPDKEWLGTILDNAESLAIPVYMKKNLDPQGYEFRQEIPEGMP